MDDESEKEDAKVVKGSRIRQDKTVNRQSRPDLYSHPRVRRNRQKEGGWKEVYKEKRKLCVE
jgi:hypothetical protein